MMAVIPSNAYRAAPESVGIHLRISPAFPFALLPFLSAFPECRQHHLNLPMKPAQGGSAANKVGYSRKATKERRGKMCAYSYTMLQHAATQEKAPPPVLTATERAIAGSTGPTTCTAGAGSPAAAPGHASVKEESRGGREGGDWVTGAQLRWYHAQGRDRGGGKQEHSAEVVKPA